MVGLSALTAGPARAAGLDAKELEAAQQARQLYKSGNYQEAAEIFSRLSAAHPDMPTFARNAGAAYYYLKRPDPALSNLREYLRAQKRIDTDDREEVEKWIAEMERLRAQASPASPPSPGGPALVPGRPGAPAQPGLPAQAVAPTGARPPGSPATSPSPGGVSAGQPAAGYPPSQAYPSPAAPTGPAATQAGQPYPQTGQPYLQTGQPYPQGTGQPQAGQPYPPQVGQPYAQPGQPYPQAGQPQAGQPYPPQAGQPYAQPGQPYPQAGQAYPQAGQPQAGQPYPPQAGQPILPQAGQPPTEAAYATGNSPDSMGQPAGTVPAGVVQETRASGQGKGPWPWVIGGVGVAALGLGGLFTYLSQSAFSDTRAQYDPDRESAGKTYSYLQFVGYGLGAAGITTAIILLLRSDRGAGDTQISITPTLGPQLAGAQLGIRY
jgi:tetratricopeptide (TPR) repeat protein